MGTTIFGISKSSIQGILSLIVVLGLQAGALQLPATLATPQSAHVLVWITFIATTVAGFAKAILAFTQGDAPNPPAGK